MADRKRRAASTSKEDGSGRARTVILPWLVLGWMAGVLALYYYRNRFLDLLEYLLHSAMGT